MSTLEQLDRYLAEARLAGSEWVGHLIAFTAYTADVAEAVKGRDDVPMGCERDPDGDPYLLKNM